MNIRGFQRGFLATSIRLVTAGCVLGLLLAAGCTTVQTERAAGDESLRSRMVKGPSREIFGLVKQCVYQEFPDGQVRANPDMGEITATVSSIITGDAVLKTTVIERPDDLVEVSVSARGVGPGQQRATIERFLADFDEAYAVWVKYRTIDRGPKD